MPRIPAEFVMSAMHLAQLPTDRLPEIALAGRSNVGKSSLINTVLQTAKLAQTSNTPGRTRALNYYRIRPSGTDRGAFYFVDMPGYGYAEISKTARAHWGQLIGEYLQQRETMKGILHIVDLRHPPQPLDFQMRDTIAELGVPFLLVGTKADKLAKSKVAEAMLVMAEALNIDTNDTLAFSAGDGMNRDELWRRILALVAG
jgi:GTP-binding protein